MSENMSNVKLMNWKGIGRRQLWPIRVLSQHFPGETEEKYKSSLLGFRAPLYTATPAFSVRFLNQNYALIYCFPKRNKCPAHILLLKFRGITLRIIYQGQKLMVKFIM